MSHMISIAELASIIGVNLDRRMKKQDRTEFDQGQVAALTWVLNKLDEVSEKLNKEV